MYIFIYINVRCLNNEVGKMNDLEKRVLVKLVLEIVVDKSVFRRMWWLYGVCILGRIDNRGLGEICFWVKSIRNIFG